MAFWQFFIKGCDGHALLVRPSKTHWKMFFFVLGADDFLSDWKAKLESAYSFMLKYSKITVWKVQVIFFKEVQMLGPTLGSQDLYFLNFVTCKKLIHFFNFQFAKFSGEAEQLREVANNQQPQIIDLDSDWGRLKAQRYDTFST